MELVPPKAEFMNEKPKSIWKKSWSGWRAFLLFAVSGFAVVLVFGIAAGVKSPATGLAGIIVGLALLVWLLVAAIRWATRPRNFKRFIFGLACLATLIALFYAEEDWRGWHAWNQFKHEWEAKGEHFDMAGVTPAPVPAEQNFALTPIAYTGYGQILTRDGRRIPWEQRDTNFVECPLLIMIMMARPTLLAIVKRGSSSIWQVGNAIIASCRPRQMSLPFQRSRSRRRRTCCWRWANMIR